MRIRRRKWAKTELEEAEFYIDNPTEYKGKWIEKYSDNVVLQYTCKHENLSTQLCLWHIFADFSEVIQKKYN